jgi:hypothetical protein
MPSHIEIEMPGSAKAPGETIRKKMFSNIKLQANNENLSQVNLVPSSPAAMGESTKAYDQLKNKISNLEGRLVEIKKSFELSFQKRTEKSRNGKENEPLREKQKSRLVLTKNEERG